ncbi:MAG: folate family ECF transporter S component [Erysipelotrichaceae bacterium]|nr:folate family ECF transporter S component [Erysipelotrichaceae bacterium]MDY5252023.1 folate family ECF transporter S component [Erysipelotrichaceae bacterium]
MFKESFNNLKSTRMLVLLALFIALKIVVGYFRIPVADNLNIYFTFIISAIECTIFGYVPSMIAGVITDILGYIINPNPPFFPGYALSNLVAAFIYSLWFYKRKIKLLNIIGAKTMINYIVNVGMGSLWSAMLYSKGFIYYASTSLIKNTILLPIEIIILFFVFKAIVPILQNRNLISRQ